MRESNSEHKKAAVYFAVMSADPHEEEPSPANHHGRHTRGQDPSPLPNDGATESANGSSNGAGVLHEEEELVALHSSSLLDSLKASMDESNDKSAFRITGVSAFDAADDLEQSKGMSREADSFVDDMKQRGQSESSESEETLKAVLVGSSGVPLPVREQEAEVTNERVLPLEGALNGPMVQPILRRFRRVNKYERGRWVVEDTLEHREADERSESEMKGALGTQISGGAIGRESPLNQRRKGGVAEDDPTQLHSRSSSDAGGQSTDPTHPGDHRERTGSVTTGTASGTGGENLSRNTSVSSLTTAGDKSVDGECSGDQLRNESESELGCVPPRASTGHSTSAVGVSSPPQPPRHPVASFPASSTFPAVSMATTSDSGDEENRSEGKSKTGVHRVEKALSHLNKELQRLVEENKEITQLKNQNKTLEEQIHDLEREKRKLEDDKRDLTAQNSDLTGRITTLQHKLEDTALDNKRLLLRNEELVHEKEQLMAKYQGLLSAHQGSGNS